MAFLARDTYIGDGATTIYPITWVSGWLDDSHVHVFVDFVETMDFTVGTDPNQVTLDTPPGLDSIVNVQRITPKVMPGDFSTQVVIRHTNLQANFDITTLWAEEAQDSDAELQSNTGALGSFVVRAEDAALDSEASAADSETAQVAAELAETGAAASLYEFIGIYYGSLASDPTLDPNGNTPTEGDQYFNTSDNSMRVYTGVFWKQTASAISTIKNEVVLANVAGQTTFNLVYDVGYLEVFYNGVRLTPTLDFTATTGTDVVLTEPVVENTDIITLVAFGAFDVNDPADARNKLNVYSKDEVYNKTEVYSKTETYNQTETYNKTELDAALTVARAGRKNYLINGGFDIAQRGLGPFTLSGEYTLDRWRWFDNGGGGSVQIGNDDGRYARVITDLASADAQIQQAVEIPASAYLMGKTVTMSFEAKSTIAETIIIRNYLYNGTDSVVVPDEPIDIDTVFKKYTFTFTIGSVPYVENETGFWVRFTFPALAAQVAIKNVQLEEGSTATPFEYVSPQQNLAECQRYYCERSNLDFSVVGNGATQDIYHMVDYPVQMRSVPSITYSFPLSSGGGATLIDALSQNSAAARVHIALAANTGRAGYGNGWVKADAEL